VLTFPSESEKNLVTPLPELPNWQAIAPSKRRICPSRSQTTHYLDPQFSLWERGREGGYSSRRRAGGEGLSSAERLGHRARDAGEPSQTGLNNDLAKEMAGQNNTSANRLRRNLFVSLLGILLLWLGACAAPARPPHLIATVTSDPKTFNTYLAAESSSRDAIAYLEAGLVTLDEDTLLPKPELAEGWEVSEDGLRYVFTLREGLRWSDGEPLTAADVDFTFNRIIFDERIPTSCAGCEANWGSWSTASGAGPGRAAD
jgi:hypothetical protein